MVKLTKRIPGVNGFPAVPPDFATKSDQGSLDKITRDEPSDGAKTEMKSSVMTDFDNCGSKLRRKMFLHSTRQIRDSLSPAGTSSSSNDSTAGLDLTKSRENVSDPTASSPVQINNVPMMSPLVNPFTSNLAIRVLGSSFSPLLASKLFGFGAAGQLALGPNGLISIPHQVPAPLTASMGSSLQSLCEAMKDTHHGLGNNSATIPMVAPVPIFSNPGAMKPPFSQNGQDRFSSNFQISHLIQPQFSPLPMTTQKVHQTEPTSSPPGGTTSSSGSSFAQVSNDDLSIGVNNGQVMNGSSNNHGQASDSNFGVSGCNKDSSVLCYGSDNNRVSSKVVGSLSSVKAATKTGPSKIQRKMNGTQLVPIQKEEMSECESIEAGRSGSRVGGEGKVGMKRVVVTAKKPVKKKKCAIIIKKESKCLTQPVVGLSSDVLHVDSVQDDTVRNRDCSSSKKKKSNQITSNSTNCSKQVVSCRKSLRSSDKSGLGPSLSSLQLVKKSQATNECKKPKLGSKADREVINLGKLLMQIEDTDYFCRDCGCSFLNYASLHTHRYLLHRYVKSLSPQCNSCGVQIPSDTVFAHKLVEHNQTQLPVVIAGSQVRKCFVSKQFGINCCCNYQNTPQLVNGAAKKLEVEDSADSIKITQGKRNHNSIEDSSTDIDSDVSSTDGMSSRRKQLKPRKVFVESSQKKNCSKRKAGKLCNGKTNVKPVNLDTKFSNTCFINWTHDPNIDRPKSV